MSRVYAPNQEYLGTGLLAAYDGDFLIQSLEHLLVIMVDDDGAEVSRVRGSDTTEIIESVEWDDSGLVAGFTVNLLVELPTDYRLIFLLAPDTPDQSFEFADKDSFSLRQIEAALDWLQGQIQRLFYWANRSLKLSDLDDPTDFDTTLPQDITDNPGKGIFINDDADGFTFLSPDDIVEGIADTGGPFAITDGMAATNVTDMTVDVDVYSSARFVCEILSTTIGSLVTLFVVNKGTTAVPAWEIKEGPTIGDEHNVIFTLESAVAGDAQIQAADNGNNGARTLKWRKVLFDA